eukprot:6173282-Pleurochrysis_carterae.AAC.1
MEPRGRANPATELRAAVAPRGMWLLNYALALLAASASLIRFKLSCQTTLQASERHLERE